MKLKKHISFLVASFIVFATVFSAPVFAGVTGTGYVKNDKDTTMYSAPGTGGEHSTRESVFVKTVPKGTTFTVLDSEKDADGDLWYKVKLDNDSTVGYLYEGRVVVTLDKSEQKYDEDFEKNLLNFPESYRASLRSIHASYPNWKFVAVKCNISLDDAITAEYGTSLANNKKYVEMTYGGEAWRDPRGKTGDDQWANAEGSGRWTYASKGAIAYFMDPRNYLNANDIFVFLQQSYSQSQTKDDVRAVISNTFLANGYDNNPDAYINDIMDAASESGLNPCVVAATIIIEQGVNGASGLISGTDSTYPDYYNYFNIGASGSTTSAIVSSGLARAQKEGWNTRRSSIIGGAKTYANGYVSSGQDTYYFMDYNVEKQSWNHQYATSIYDAKNKGLRLKTGCTQNANATLTFKIPVFTSIPETVYGEPTDSTPVTPTPIPTRKRGDINGDGKITAYDLAQVQMHLLEKIDISSNTYADINGDGKITAYDLAQIQMHLLNKINLLA